MRSLMVIPTGACLLALLLLLPLSATASTVPYSSYTLGSGGFIAVPTSYEPGPIFTLADQGLAEWNKPQDLFLSGDDKLYVADTGNNRVVALDGEGRVMRIYGADEQFLQEAGALSSPRGVYVDSQGIVYVADTGGQRIVLFHADGSLLRVLERPDSPLLGPRFSYQPSKLIVDSRGYIYAVSQGSQQGLLMLDAEGEFRGFFGGNRTNASWMDRLVRLLYSRDQRRGIVNLPYSFNNLFLSQDGFLYAATTGVEAGQVRKLDASGGNAMPLRDFSDRSLAREQARQNFTDMTVDQDGNLTLVDKQFGRLYQFDSAGRMLFAFGAIGFGRGLLASPSAIAADSRGDLYVLDEAHGHIQVYRKTAFAASIHRANALYNAGRYEEAAVPWQEVLRLHASYTPALQAMGQIRLRQERYSEAMVHFRAAGDKTGYSAAFYEWRRQQASSRFGELTLAAFGIVALLLVVRNPRVRSRLRPTGRYAGALNRFIRQSVWVMLHPVQGFEELRYEGKGRVADAIVLLLAFTAVQMLQPVLVGFLYESAPLEQVRWGAVIGNSLLPWLLWSVVGYGMAAIADGEGRFRDICISAAYCLLPLIVFSLPLALLTRIMTLQEANFYGLAQTVLAIWTVLLMFFQVKETNDFEAGKALRLFCFTALGCVTVVGLFLIFYGLGAQMIEFVVQLVKEDLLYGL